MLELDFSNRRLEALLSDEAFLHVCVGLKWLELSHVAVSWNGFLDPLVRMRMTR